jgi:hypothetical protein
MKRSLTTISIIFFTLFGTIALAGEGAWVVFDDPSYPPTFQYFMWSDDQGSGLTVVMALWEDEDPILADALEVFLPESAMKFTPDFGFPIPDTINYRSNEVPVAVYDGITLEEIVGAYSNYYVGGRALLEDHLIASGFVKGKWVGKNFKATTYSAIGPVYLEKEEGEAILVATGHEVFKDGPLEIPETHEKVELHW